MAEQKMNNKALEEAIAAFRSDKERDSYVKVMELLEKSIVLVPAIPPKDMDPALMEQLKTGKPVQFPRGNRRCLFLLRHSRFPRTKRVLW